MAALLAAPSAWARTDPRPRDQQHVPGRRAGERVGRRSGRRRRWRRIQRRWSERPFRRGRRRQCELGRRAGGKSAVRQSGSGRLRATGGRWSPGCRGVARRWRRRWLCRRWRRLRRRQRVARRRRSATSSSMAAARSASPARAVPPTRFCPRMRTSPASAGSPGRESSVTASWIAMEVKEGRLRWVIVDNTEGGSLPSDTRTGSQTAMDVVAKTCRAVTLSSSGTNGRCTTARGAPRRFSRPPRDRHMIQTSERA